MNKKLKSILLGTLIIFSHSASGQKSDTLGLFVSSSEDCPFDSQELREKIEGEFVKARINSTDNETSFLDVFVSCMQIKNGNEYVYGNSISVDIRFGTTLESGQQVVERFSRGTMMYGSDKEDSKLFYFNVIKDKVSDALVVYLQDPILSSTHYILRLMSLQDKENATNVVSDLKSRGYNSLSIESDGFFQIFVTTDQGLVHAQKLAEELEKITGSKSKIMKSSLPL